MSLLLSFDKISIAVCFWRFYPLVLYVCTERGPSAEKSKCDIATIRFAGCYLGYAHYAKKFWGPEEQ